MVWIILISSTIGGLGIAGLVIWLVWHFEKKRTEALAATAADLGMEFSPLKDEPLLQRLKGFSLFNKGHSRRMKNVLKAETELARLTIFDYQYTTGGGQNSQTHSHTLVAMESDTIHLPDFSIRPEGLLDRIGAKLGFQDIDFDEFPQFSKMFVVQGADESAVRRFFDAEIVELLQQRGNVAVDACADLFTYREGGRKKPEEIRELMEQSYVLYQAFHQRLNS